MKGGEFMWKFLKNFVVRESVGLSQYEAVKLYSYIKYAESGFFAKRFVFLRHLPGGGFAVGICANKETDFLEKAYKALEHYSKINAVNIKGGLIAESCN
jgi:hypothetical protein